jgi:predicted nucleotidyltransferase
MPAIRNVVRQVTAQFQPEKVILFGSYAYGHPQPESDVDLLVIMRTPLKPMEQAVRICQAIEYHFGLDLIVGGDANTPDVADTAHLCYTHASQKRLDFEFESDVGRWEAQNDA